MKQTEGTVCWTAWNELFLLCKPGWYSHHTVGFPRDGKWAPQVSLRGLRGALPRYPPPHLYDCGDTLLYTYIKALHVDEVWDQSLCWNSGASLSETSLKIPSIILLIKHTITYTDKARRLRWRGLLWNSVKKHSGYLNQMLLNSPQELLA